MITSTATSKKFFVSKDINILSTIATQIDEITKSEERIVIHVLFVNNKIVKHENFGIQELLPDIDDLWLLGYKIADGEITLTENDYRYSA